MTISKARLVRVLNGRFSFQEEEKAEKITENELKFAMQAAQSIVKLVTEHDINQLVLVRMSFRFPFNGKLLTSGDHPSLMKDFFDESERGYKRILKLFKLRVPRQTLHFTLNSVAPDVGMDNASWRNCPFAIIIPLKDVKDKICSLHEIDTFIFGNLTLPSSALILVRKQDYDKRPEGFEKHKGNAKIRIIEKDTVYPYVIPILRELGYPVFESHERGWANNTTGGLDDLVDGSVRINIDTVKSFNALTPAQIIEFCQKHYLIKYPQYLEIIKTFEKGGFIDEWKKIIEKIARNLQINHGVHEDHLTQQIEWTYTQALGVLSPDFSETAQDGISSIKYQIKWLSKKLVLVNRLLKGETVQASFKRKWKLSSKEEIKAMKKIRSTVYNLIMLLNEIKTLAEKHRTMKYGEFLHKYVTGNEFKNAEKTFKSVRSKLR